MLFNFLLTQYLKLGWDIILTCLGCFNVEDIGHTNQYLFLLSLIGENTDLDFEEIIDDFCTFFIAGWYDNNDTLHVGLFCTTYNSKYTVELCLDFKINVLLNPFFDVLRTNFGLTQSIYYFFNQERAICP